MRDELRWWWQRQKHRLWPDRFASLFNWPSNFNDLPFREKLQHVRSKGKVGRHSLEGGWCPLCGTVYYYDNRDGDNWNTSSEVSVDLMPYIVERF
jgi:hypothetical protein